MFKKYAEFYDRINSQKDYKGECKFIYEWAGKPKTILDIGCGTAQYWQYIPAEMKGIELSEDMIAQSPYKNHIIHGDITELPRGIFDKTYDCVTALFQVMNYIPIHDWWRKLPLKDYFIFDIWDKKKAQKDGFKVTEKEEKGIFRLIVPKPIYHDLVELSVIIGDKGHLSREKHLMYLYSEDDIQSYCGKDFIIEDRKETDTWQTWYKLKKL